MTEICKKCAECCKNNPCVNLSGNEIKFLEKVTGLRSDAFTYPKGKGVEEYILQFKKNGDCFFLKKKSGNYFCSVYETRPRICKNYPSKPIQKEVCYAHSKKFL